MSQRKFDERRLLHPVASLPGSMGRCSMWGIVGALVLEACTPKLNVGNWQCPSDGTTSNGGASDGGASDGGAVGARDPVTLPWSTGFEDGFCDYTRVAGYCYGDQPYALVTEPHRVEGRLAAEFKVVSAGQKQTRCVRSGELPESAYYGAWYYIPEPLTAVTVWNLFHFDRPDFSDDPRLKALWDVTLVTGAEPGEWELLVFDPLTQNGDNTYRSAAHTPIPFGKWFHIELFLKRATDATGEIALYQDGVLLFERKNLKSDASKFSQWYVGDLAYEAMPANSSLYVDDVSISATLSSTSGTP